jgi:hypothetical protein
LAIEVTNLYDKSPQRLAADDPQELFKIIQTFIATCREPAVFDFGDNPIALAAGRYALEVRSGRLWIEAWDDERNLARRILRIERIGIGVLECAVQRFGGATGSITFLDRARPQTAARAVRGKRQSQAEKFRRILQRQFPGWEITNLSSALDLRRSFSATYPRAVLSKGSRLRAALFCPAIEDEASFLTSSLLWFDWVSRHNSQATSVSLCLFLPEGAGALTAHRLKWLTGVEFEKCMYRYNEHGMAGEVDPADVGNLETRLRSSFKLLELLPEWRATLSHLQSISGVGCCPEHSGALSVRYRGLEFARFERDRILLGIENREEVLAHQIERVEKFAHNLASLSLHPETSELPAFEERWFESVVRCHLHLLDPELLAEPVHGQILTFAGVEREIVDLVAANDSGQLTVLELKTSEDMDLPLQALDYWIQIGWHARRGELAGLFPTLSLTTRPPKLLLVAPAFSFHPSNEIVLRYFSPDIEVQRIGVNSEWGRTFRVAFRLTGGELPISHRGADETRRINQH